MPDGDNDFAFSEWDEVSIRLCDGRTETRRVAHARGSMANPLPPELRRAKFKRCADPVLGATASGRLFEALERLENVSSLAELRKDCEARH